MLHAVPPTLQQATTDHTSSRGIWTLASPVSLSWGHCSFLLGPGAHKALFVPSMSLFPQFCVISGSSMVELMATSSKRAYAILKNAALRVPAPVAGHCGPFLHRRHSNTQRQVWLSLCGIPWCTQDCVWALWVSLIGMVFDSKCDFTPPTILLGFLLLPLDTGYLFLVGSNILLMIVQQWIVILSSCRRRWVPVFLLSPL